MSCRIIIQQIFYLKVFALVRHVNGRPKRSHHRAARHLYFCNLTNFFVSLLSSRKYFCGFFCFAFHTTLSRSGAKKNLVVMNAITAATYHRKNKIGDKFCFIQLAKRFVTFIRQHSFQRLWPRLLIKLIII